MEFYPSLNRGLYIKYQKDAVTAIANLQNGESFGAIHVNFGHKIDCVELHGR
jgi:hypothetical protein